MEFKFLNILKGFAIVFVILVHTSQSFVLPEYLSRACSLGQMGCQLFFVISGFTVALSFYNRNESLGHFYKRRFLSILPAWYIAIALYGVINIVRFVRGGTIFTRKL